MKRDLEVEGKQSKAFYPAGLREVEVIGRKPEVVASGRDPHIKGVSRVAERIEA
jgi:hypothetical protein